MGCSSSTKGDHKDEIIVDPKSGGSTATVHNQDNDAYSPPDKEAPDTSPADETVILSDGQPEKQPEAQPDGDQDLGPQDRAFRDLLAGKAGPGIKLEDAMPCLAPVGVPRPSTTGPSLDDYVAQHASDFRMLLDLEKDPRWTFKKTEQAVDIHSFFDDKKGLVAFKGSTDVACGSLKEGTSFLLESLFEAARRPEFDDMCLLGETVEQALPYYRVVYYQFRSPARGIVTDRDCLLIVRFCFEPDGSLAICVRSTVHEKVPENPSFVRLDFMCGGYTIRVKDDSSLRLSFFGVVDPKGWIPSFVKNLAALKQPLVLAKFKNKFGV